MAHNYSEVVVISGASAGVGRATAVEFAKRGAAVALLARGRVGLEAAAAEVERAGGKALIIPTDVADAAQVEAAADQIERELGPINTWVNSAMVTMFSSFHEMSAEEFDRITHVTYTGTVYGTRAALKRMRPRNSGKIIQVGSALAYRSVPLQSAYCGAKAAIRGFTDSVRVELMHEKSKIRICMVQLGAFNTPQFQWARSKLEGRPQPLPPIYQPEVAARSIVWAADHGRRELWNTFSAMKTIVGGFLLPTVGDHLALKQAYSGQNDRDTRKPSERPDNLFEPVEQNFGAHGRFDDESKESSWYLQASVNRKPIMLGLLAAAALVGATAAAQRKLNNAGGGGFERV